MLSRLSLRSHLILLVTPLVGVAAAACVVAAQAAGATTAVIAVAATAAVVTVISGWLVRRLARSGAEVAAASAELAGGGVAAIFGSLHDDLAHRVPRPVDIEAGGCAELTATADALNRVAAALVEVAGDQQDALRSGISDLFVNLARRNQALLDRQIEFIDHLEAHEEDPDQLEQLFRLDHLATRMRRNAESLLVLAGAEVPRTRARDVSVEDVVRVAVGEIEDFGRIGLLGVDDAEVSGAVAVDLAHLLAELIENSTQYSSPDQTVDVIGHRAGDGGYVLTVRDRGVGMDDDDVAAANRTLARPPAVGLAASRELGFVVVGTLAVRHDIEVRLERSAFGGLNAQVSIPARHVVVAAAEQHEVEAPEVEAQEVEAQEVEAQEVEPVAAGWTAEGEYVSAPADDPRPEPQPEVAPEPIRWASERVPVGSTGPSRLADVLPEGDAFEAGLYGLLVEDDGPNLYDPIFDGED